MEISNRSVGEAERKRIYRDNTAKQKMGKEMKEHKKVNQEKILYN